MEDRMDEILIKLQNDDRIITLDVYEGQRSLQPANLEQKLIRKETKTAILSHIIEKVKSCKTVEEVVAKLEGMKE